MTGWNGNGTFSRLYSWVADTAAGIDISSVRMDGDTDNITVNGFNNCLTRDGQGSATNNLPMNGFRHTGAGNAVNPQDYVTLSQFGGSSFIQGAFVGEIRETSLPESLLPTLMPGFYVCAGQTRPRTDPLWEKTGAISAGFWLFGNGDGATTYTLPDERGRVALGKDDMGGTPSGRVTSAVSDVDSTTLGGSGGDQNAQADTITTTLSGSVTAASTATSTVTESPHDHATNAVQRGSSTGSNYIQGGSVYDTTAATNTAAVTGLTVATSVTTAITNTMGVSSTSGLTGAAQNVQPVLVINKVIFVGA